MKQVGIEALLTLIIQFGFIWMTFKSIQAVHIERFFHQTPKGLSMLIVLISIAVGYTCASFFMNFFDSIRNLTFLIK
ncbi:DUF1146 family protein [Paucilactobacillus wasatchensis]|uniref:DUF1146 domain-containing protein n=1 Tax=Paucilactobacillus wasatchensis TaxID=1335616 RepID=A0A0D0Y7J9_9LACO|nr:DUF1146 domain-containing protein [Paucilactobacillus wasatchensis]KIS04243.1 hypothetical protein WDC_0174 [Paucilactobacillus wasatchensis]